MTSFQQFLINPYRHDILEMFILSSIQKNLDFFTSNLRIVLQHFLNNIPQKLQIELIKDHLHDSYKICLFTENIYIESSISRMNLIRPPEVNFDRLLEMLEYSIEPSIDDIHTRLEAIGV